MKLRGIIALALALAWAPAFAQTNPGTSPLSVIKGGTGASTGTGARDNLGIVETRAAAINKNLSAFSVIRTLGYATATDGGGATFVKIGSSVAFKDSFITGASLTSGGASCPNGTYKGIHLVGGGTAGRGARVNLTVSGSVVTAVNSLNSPGNGYKVGEALTGSIGCGTDWTYTVSSVSTPLASFTDSVGTRWQYVPDTFINPKQFGAKFDCVEGLNCDAAATNDFASIQASLWFANYHASATQNLDLGSAYSSRVVLPFGTAKVCVSGTTYNTLIVPDSVVLEGQSKFGSILKQCDSDTASHHFVTLGVPLNEIACFGAQIRNLELFAGLGSANVDVAMIFTNCAQQGKTIDEVAVYSIFRMCFLATDGFGGASDLTVNGLMCNINYQAPSQTSIIKANYNGATIKLHEIILESGNNIAINGITIVNIGGTVNIQNFHAEQISIPIFFNATGGSTVGVVIFGITGGNGCTSLVKRQSGSVANRITLGTAVKAACTNTYDNAGALTTTDVYNWVNF